MAGPSFDPTINLGTVLGVLGILVTLYKLHMNNVGRFERLETKVDLLWAWWAAQQVKRRDDTRDGDG